MTERTRTVTSSFSPAEYRELRAAVHRFGAASVAQFVRKAALHLSCHRADVALRRPGAPARQVNRSSEEVLGRPQVDTAGISSTMTDTATVAWPAPADEGRRLREVNANHDERPTHKRRGKPCRAEINEIPWGHN